MLSPRRNKNVPRKYCRVMHCLEAFDDDYYSQITFITNKSWYLAKTMMWAHFYMILYRYRRGIFTKSSAMFLITSAFDLRQAMISLQKASRLLPLAYFGVSRRAANKKPFASWSPLCRHDYFSGNACLVLILGGIYAPRASAFR